MKETPVERVERALRDKEITLGQLGDAIDEVEREERPLNMVFWVVIGAAVAYFAGHIVAAYIRKGG